MITNASKYAIRAVVYLAENASKDCKLGAKEVAENVDLPQYFIAKILQQLAKGGIINSVKGPQGGFYLNKEKLKHTMLDVIHYIDEGEVFTECFIGLKQCSDEKPCPVHHVVSPFKQQILSELGKTIDVFTKDVKENGTYLSLD
jgi:Rrf2 family protein